jgi:hypothetical protein
VNGRWRFNSGIKHAEWSIGGVCDFSVENYYLPKEMTPSRGIC